MLISRYHHPLWTKVASTIFVAIGVGAYTIMGKDRYGCATRRAKGTCGNAKTITRQKIESRVLGGLKGKLMAPELVAEFVRAFQEEMNAAARETASRGDELRREVEGIVRKLARSIR
jgi:site-specific DNA recombinase